MSPMSWKKSTSSPILWNLEGGREGWREGEREGKEGGREGGGREGGREGGRQGGRRKGGRQGGREGREGGGTLASWTIPDTPLAQKAPEYKPNKPGYESTHLTT